MQDRLTDILNVSSLSCVLMWTATPAAAATGTAGAREQQERPVHTGHSGGSLHWTIEEKGEK